MTVTFKSVIVAFFCPCTLIGQRAADRPVAVVDASIVDVRAGRVVPHGTVVVRGTRISAVGPANHVLIPADAIIIDGKGKFVIPGLWDMHVHAAQSWPGQQTAFGQLFVANGVTGIRDMYGKMKSIDAWRTRVGARDPQTPRIVASGHLLDGPSPLWGGSVVASTPADGRRAVDSLLGAGADFIKVYSFLARDVFFAIAAEAQQRGVPFAGHVPIVVGAAEASDAGQRSIEHLTNVTLGCADREQEFLDQRIAAAASTGGRDSLLRVVPQQTMPVISGLNPAKCRSLGARFAANGTRNVPTLTQLRGAAYMDESSLARDPRLGYLDSQTVDAWANPASDDRFKSRTADDWARAKVLFATQKRVVGELYHGGAPLLAGTDTPNPYCLPGFGLHDELQLLVEAGVTPLDALRAATLNVGKFLGKADLIGSVVVGGFADLVVLDANPLLDIRNTTRIRAVISNGVYLNRSTLDTMLAQAKHSAAHGYR